MQPFEDSNRKAKPTGEQLSGQDELLSQKKPAEIVSDFDRTLPTAQTCAFTNSSAYFVGKTLNGHFELLSLIGEGGMSYVYKARDVILNKIVAVKILRPNLLDQPNIARRLQAEAAAISSLDHPNTVGVRHFEVTPEGLPYLVMVYLDGTSIADIIAKAGAFEPTRAIKIFKQIAEALAHAHSKSIIHRDLKAKNVLLINYDGDPDFVKVVDFGIAKVMNPDGLDIVSHLTITGEVFGSPIAMSPEQCRGEKVDVRSDVYSFGCLMYQMLTGRTVFGPISNFHLLLKQSNDMPESFKAVYPQGKIPAQLEAITFKALQKDPSDRYQSMQDLLSDLKAVERPSATSGMYARLQLANQKLRHDKRLLYLISACAVILTTFALYATVGKFILEQDMLLTQVIPWQTSPTTPASQPKTTVTKLKERILKEAENGERALLMQAKRTSAPSSKPGSKSQTNAKTFLANLRSCASASAPRKPPASLALISESVCAAAHNYANIVQPDDNVQDVRVSIQAIKNVGNELLKHGASKQAELVYWSTLAISKSFSGDESADDQYYSKLIADSCYRTAEYDRRPVTSYERRLEYDRAREYYNRFFPTKNDPRLATKQEYSICGDTFVSWTADFDDSPLAWDARRKRAECEYYNQKYPQAVNDYQWVFNHMLPKPVMMDREMAILNWHAADSARLVLQKDTTDVTAPEVLAKYNDGLLWERRNSDPNPRNVALCHSYMLALVYHFDLPTEHLPKGTTVESCLSEMRQAFGENDPTTLLVESQYAAELWNKNEWARAAILWLHVKLNTAHWTLSMIRWLGFGYYAQQFYEVICSHT